jgi:NitT/TauT family transport system substrate-binding protein
MRAIELTDAEKALGAKGDVVVTGYVFDEGFAAKNKDALARFFAASRKAKELIATSDRAWGAVIAQRLAGKDARTLDIYRKRYVAGAPKRAIAEEEADARAVYGALAGLGGEKLVGPGKTLDPGTFYKGAEGRPR